MRDFLDDLRPAPDRIGGTLRITFSALLAAIVMLAFQMPFLSIGPYLVFILSQRDMFLTRAAAVLGIAVAAVASLAIYLIASLAWDTGWLRVSLWAAIFYGGFLLMRVCVEPRMVVGPLVVVALFTYAFDKAPDPNMVVSKVGWLWAILGLVIVCTFLSQWIFQAPTGIDLLRRQFREILLKVERVSLAKSAGNLSATSGFEFEEAEGRIKKLASASILTPAQAANCQSLLEAAFQILRDDPAKEKVPEASPGLARWVRQLRRRILLGSEAGPLLPFPDPLQIAPALREAAAKLHAAAHRAFIEGDSVPSRESPSLLVADWRSNPEYADFALRAMLATMGCYLFMTMTDWNGIHTCLITCAVTALPGAEAQMRKQNLRITGALIGGLLGMGAVIFLIPRMDSFFAYLGILAAGTAIAAWVSLGSERISYAGWQIALAFYMTILQDPHPTTKLDVIRDRWVGIFIGIVAMRAAFAWLRPLPDPKTVRGEP